jgi:hypothetical protein
VFNLMLNPGSPFLRANATPTGDQSRAPGPVFARTKNAISLDSSSTVPILN